MRKTSISIMLILCLLSLVFTLSVLTFKSLTPNTAKVQSLYSEKQITQSSYTFETQKISKAKTISIIVEEGDNHEEKTTDKIASTTRTTKDLSSASLKVNSQTGNLNVTKDEFFNFSISIECTAANCDNLILTLDPFENFSPEEIQTAQNELDKIKQDVENQGLSWTPKLTDVFIEYVTKKNNGELTYNEPDSESGKRTTKSAITEKDESIIPYFFDWTNAYGQNWITPAKNQGSCNGCWAFAAVSASEAALNIYNKWPSLQLNLSEQDVITNSGGGSCTVGGNDNTALFFIRDTGIVDEECFPFQAVDVGTGKCSNGYQYNINGVVTIVQDGSGSVDKGTAIRNLIKYGPATAQVNTYTDLAAYSGGIYEPSTTASYGAHIITIVGYNETEDYFIIKNSWGTSWGMNGFAYVKSWFILNDPLIFNRLRFPTGAEKLDKGIIPMNSGEPFYTITQNPYDCGNLTLGQTCDVTWQVNATGFHNSNWNFFIIVDMNNGTEKFNSDASIIRIIGDSIPEIQKIECESKGTWKSCDEIQENNTLTKIRTNITDDNSNIQNVNIRLKENNTILNQGSASIENGFYVYNSNYLINSTNLHKIEVDVSDETYSINGQIKFTPLEYVPDLIAPIIELELPINASTDNDGNVTIQYKTSDNIEETLYCDIYSNTSGIWQIDSTQIVTNASSNIYSYNELLEGNYIWNVKCSDGTNSAYAISNYTFNIYIPDVIAPIVELTTISGTDNDGNVTIEYKATDNKENFLSCDIYSNTSGIWQIDSTQIVTNNTLNNYLYTNLTDGVYRWNVRCNDGTNSAFSSVNKTFTVYIPDLTAPVISNINVNNVLDESAEIGWNTDELANSSINYGLTAALGTIIDTNGWRTSHNENLYSLIADTLYYYQITSCDASGNCASEGPFTFNTLPAIDDPAIWNTLSNKNIDEDSLGGVIYSNLKNECSDIDSPIDMSVTSTHNHFNLFFSGNDLEINNLEYNWYGTETVDLDCNGIANNFDLTVNSIQDCVTVCTFGSCRTYCE